MDPVDLIQNGKLKRFFRATRKLTSPQLISHLTQRAAGKEPLFVEDSDYIFMLANLREIAQKRSLTVFAFCLMPNHLHLLLRPEVDDLADIMRDLFARYAMRFNRKYKRKGHLFGGPYRQAVCLDDTYLLAASLYIHTNPVKAGLCEIPEQYRWSSVQAYSAERSFNSFISHEFILNLLGGLKEGKENYRQMLEKCRNIDAEMIFEKPNALHGFRSRLAVLFPQIFRSIHGIHKVAGAKSLDPEELEERIEAVLSGKVGIKPESAKAMKFFIEQMISRGFAKTEIAQLLGISRKTVYNLLAREFE